MTAQRRTEAEKAMIAAHCYALPGLVTPEIVERVISGMDARMRAECRAGKMPAIVPQGVGVRGMGRAPRCGPARAALISGRRLTVMRALLGGPAASIDLSARTGLSAGTCSGYCATMCRDGLAQREMRRRQDRYGHDRSMWVYSLTAEGLAALARHEAEAAR